MLIPCIDLQSGQAVQLVHGRRRELAVSDVNAQLHKFRRYKWLHIIDLDAAMNKGHNNALVASLCKRARRKYKMNVRVGGGIRSIARAKQLIKLGATQIIDMATLTGAVSIALGDVNSEILGTDQTLIDQAIEAGKGVGEKFWQLPLDDEYTKQIKSDIADIKNVGGKKAGTISRS